MTSAATDVNKNGPQESMNEFWDNLVTKNPRKITNIFPASLYANLLPNEPQADLTKGKNAAESYEAAAEACRARVKQIIRECYRTNEKFTDPEFDIESDLRTRNCLDDLMSWYHDPPSAPSRVNARRLRRAFNTLIESDILNGSYNMVVDINAASKVLKESSSPSGPGSVHRIDWIYENPSFTVDSFSSSDVKQGSNGDCWFIAALATICSNPSLMEKICVARDAECQECGVYGFVFYRDGEWTWTVIDDNLYLTYSDFDAYGDEYDPTGSKERKHRKNHQTGSDALYFASCADQNETWLPLLEKAYAKVHGDYEAVSGGKSGEAVEDLTGGVTTIIRTNRILSKERLWSELLQVNKEFLFSASSPGSYGDDGEDVRLGIALNHAYSVIKAVEEKDEQGQKHRFVLIRNPWGERLHAGMGEWNGPWSDGSKEWTPYWLNKLSHQFGNDGLFWMSYRDFCVRFPMLDRTRLIDAQWTVVQRWTSVPVAWITGYLATKFVVEIKKAGPTVFVLAQLDGRYFRGLEGKYTFDLHFVLRKKGSSAGEYLVRASNAWFGNRSISAEIDLEPGRYEVLPKVVATRDTDTPDVYDVVTKVADRNPQKLRQIGMNYDIANAKGLAELTEEEKEEKKVAEEKKQKEKTEAEKEKAEFEAWKKEKREKGEREKIVKETSKEEQTKKEIGEKEKVETEKQSSEGTQSDSKNGKSQPIEPQDIEVPKDANDKEEVKYTKPTPTMCTSGDVPPEAPEPPQTREAPKSHEDPEAPEPRTPVLAPSPPNPPPEPSNQSQPQAQTQPSEPEAPKKWNAICVLGLRVYSHDPDVSITLVKPQSVGEAVKPLVEVEVEGEVGISLMQGK